MKERGDKIENELKIIDDKYKKIKMDNDAKLNSADKVRLERFDETSLKKKMMFMNLYYLHL